MRMGKDDSLSPVHLLYDLTPPELVTAVCTEASHRPILQCILELTSSFQVGLIPPSSVPTVITKGDAAGL
jgi:translation initiation factor 2B subunit (eIF-2B alpha/beta/delta family)